ncbi:MAG TPA: hypothetical protein VGL08_08905 [Paraburkholderia sp.]|jgi:hypothetical protein
MLTVRSTPFLPAIAATTLLASVFVASSAFAASASGRQPLILDTQHGINDGQSGTVLQTAPLSHEPIVEAKPAAQPAQLAPNSSMPLYVAPYIQLPAGGQSGQPPTHSGQHPPHPRPVPQPQ